MKVLFKWGKRLQSPSPVPSTNTISSTSHSSSLGEDEKQPHKRLKKKKPRLSKALPKRAKKEIIQEEEAQRYFFIHWIPMLFLPCILGHAMWCHAITCDIHHRGPLASWPGKPRGRGGPAAWAWANESGPRWLIIKSKDKRKVSFLPVKKNPKARSCPFRPTNQKAIPGNNNKNPNPNWTILPEAETSRQFQLL